MDVSELVDIALATTDQHRVEVTALEPAEVAKEAVGGLTQLVTELVENAIAFSEPDQRVAITGVFDRDAYLISILDDGVGIPEPLMAALNNVLSDHTTAQSGDGAPLGIMMVARLAARHGIDVRLVPAVPGTTARITIPSRLVTSVKSEIVRSDESSEVAPALQEAGYSPGHVVAMTETARREAEAFLASVFGPLRGGAVTRRPTKSNGNGQMTAPPSPPAPSVGPQLQTRVPGANFPVTDDDPSVTSGERAIDIRINLTRYDEGRRQAADTEVPEDDDPSVP